MNLEDIYQRTELLLGKEKLELLKNAKVCVFGVGGVGSYVVEALARIGVGNIVIVDKDVVDVTNINRQLIALSTNVGLPKVDVCKKRISEINPSICVTAINSFVDKSNVRDYITEDLDYVVDAIDTVESKIDIIKRCKELNVKIISSMGMANRLDPLKLKVQDISKTEVCPLAKVVRKRLKEERISKVKVIYSTETAIKTNSKTLGSVSFVPSVAGLVIASEVVKDLIDKKDYLYE